MGGRMTAYDFRPGALCDIDAQPVRGHQRCHGCLILAGDGHYDQRLIGGLCAMCRARTTLNAVTEPVIPNFVAERYENQAYMLVIERGMTMTQAAREMRTTPRTVRGMVYRAHKRRDAA